MSATDLCNLALDRLGHNKVITNVDTDTSAEALACRRWYAHCRDEVLTQFHWAFARRWVALAVVADGEAPGWEYAYRYPTDCLRALSLSDEDGLRVGATTTGLTNLSPFWVVPYKYEFQIMGDDAGRLIMTDLAEAYLWYTARVTDTTQFDPLFRSLLAWKLAVELGAALKADPRMIQLAAQSWMLASSQAQAAALNEQQASPRLQSPSVTCRA